MCISINKINIITTRDIVYPVTRQTESFTVHTSSEFGDIRYGRGTDVPNVYVLSEHKTDLIEHISTETEICFRSSKIGYVELEQIASDQEIISLLPEGFVFNNLSELVALISFLFSTQNQRNSLLNNCFANVFYVSDNMSGVYPVMVAYRAGYKDWMFNSKQFNSTWHAGRRIFVANVDLSI
ncbi:MAG: hypothetical protein UZ19_OD1000973 [Parcubacteria bacterium OLB19]|nr:MAG: hypothetical protein UZ19_OD1000973 [Parcubacteria bacterium OLB19]